MISAYVLVLVLQTGVHLLGFDGVVECERARAKVYSQAATASMKLSAFCVPESDLRKGWYMGPYAR